MIKLSYTELFPFISSPCMMTGTRHSYFAHALNAKNNFKKKQGFDIIGK